MGRSEVERRQPYFEQLEGKALVPLIKTCLHNDPSQRPTAEQLVTELEEVKGGIEGPCGELATMDAARQVKTAMALKKEKVDQLVAKDQEIQRLQQQLEVPIVLINMLLNKLTYSCNDYGAKLNT